MKVLFAGPSLFGTNPDLGDIVLRPPACRGDILDATRSGATAIGLVDGNFEAAAAVWHKEILYALSEGVAVYGASSMGALRAAECAPFGMQPIGAIANAYADGSLDDDASVALQHGPAEFGYMPFTLPLVDVLATLNALEAAGEILQDDAKDMADLAASLHFKDRTMEAICTLRPDLAPTFARGFRSQKTADALALIRVLRDAPDRRGPPPATWTLAPSPFWLSLAASRPPLVY